MEDVDTTFEVEAELNGETPPSAEGPSYVDLLRQDYKELVETEEVFIPVMGYERVGLQVRYRMPESGKELDAISRKVMREFKDTFSRNLYTAVDTMIVLCTGLFVEPQFELIDSPDPPVGPAPLDPDNSGEPAYFDQRLAEIMGFEGVASARQVVRRMFAGNDLAVISHAEKLSRWLANTKADLDVEFWQLGEGR